MYNNGEGWREHVIGVRNEVERMHADLLIEVGAGDCSFLDSVKTNGVKLAVDPSLDSAIAAKELGIQHIRGYFNPSFHIPDHDEPIPCVGIVMRHLLEHIEKPRDFLEDIIIAASNKCVFLKMVIEVPCCDKALRNGRIEDWTYEHPHHFTKKSLRKLLERCGAVDKYIKTSYGGEVLVASVNFWSDDQNDVDIICARYKMIEARISELKTWILDNNDSIAYWGGAGKSAMFLRKIGVPDDALVVDSHNNKWGMYVPGTRIQILPPTRLFEGDPRTIIATTSWRADDIAREITRNDIPCRRLLKFQNGEFKEVPLGN